MKSKLKEVGEEKSVNLKKLYATLAAKGVSYPRKTSR